MEIDQTPPDLVAGSVVLQPPVVRRGGTLTADFEATEPLASAPEVWVAGRTMAAVGDVEPPRYSFSLALDPEEADGIKAPAAVLTDLAGNRDVAPLGTVRYDRRSPGLAFSAVVPSRSRPGGEVLVTLTSDEPLGRLPDLLGPSLPGAAPTRVEGSAGGTFFRYRYSVPVDAPDSRHLLQVQLSDLAGNESIALDLADALTVDATPPELTELRTNADAFGPPPSLPAEVVLTFRVTADDEETPPQVSATLGGEGMACASGDVDADAWQCSSPGPDDPSAHGHRTISVTAVDAAGNFARDTTLGVQFDLRPPALVGSALLRTPVFAPAVEEPAEAGDPETVHYHPTDPLSGAPVRLELFAFSDESLAPEPPPELALTGRGGVVLRQGSVAGERAHFDLAPDRADDPLSPGPYTLAVTWSDAVGNRATLPLSDHTVVVDGSLPSADSLLLEQIEYARCPWGCLAVGPGGGFSVTGEPGAVAEAAGEQTRVVAYLAREAGPAQQIGLGRVAPDRSFLLDQLTGGDLPTVWLALVERSGARSEPVAVSRIHWTASLGRKVPGSLLENPHRFEQRPWFTGALLQPASFELGAADGVASRDDAPPQITLGQPTWRREWRQRPSPRAAHALTWDSARAAVVLVAGAGASAGDCDSGQTDQCVGTWEWSVGGWRVAAPADPEGDGDPPALLEPALAYDSRRGVVLQHGGVGFTRSGGTWEWDGTSWRRPSVVDPEEDGGPYGSIRGHRLAYDVVRGETLLFGGAPWVDELDDQVVDDLWAWNGTSWRRVEPDAPGPDGTPSPRGWSGMAWDQVRERLVVFSGVAFADFDLWVCPDGSEPTRFGTCPLDDLWEWDGASWARITPVDLEGDGSPEAREDGSLVYDATLGLTVLAGGMAADEDCDGAGTSYCSVVWGWDGREWHRLHAAADPTASDAPGPVKGLRLAFDTAKGVVVAFGGSYLEEAAGGACRSGIEPDFTGDCVAGDLWELSAAGWRLRVAEERVDEPRPSPRQRTPILYDPVRERALLFGGAALAEECDGVIGLLCGSLWEWDGARWSLRCDGEPAADTCAEQPSARRNPTLAFDGRRGITVLFGGSTTGQSCDGHEPDACGGPWEWDGQSWERRCDGVPAADTCDEAPGPRVGHASAYDDARGVTVVYGGWDGWRPGRQICPDGSNAILQRCFYRDLWEWDGEAWHERVPDDPEQDGNPWPQEGHAMAYDALREVTVLFGGQYDVGSRDDLCPDGSPADDLGICYDLRVWEWDGTSWRSSSPTPDVAWPSWREDHGLVYDAARRRIILDGGIDELLDEPSEWTWDGTTWTPRAVADPELDGDLGFRSRHSFAYDSGRDTLLAFGGPNHDDALWEGFGGEAVSPAQVLLVDFGAAQAADPEALEEISVVWRGAGLAGAGGDCPVRPGAELVAWQRGGWRTLDRQIPDPWERDADGRPPWHASGDATWDHAWSSREDVDHLLFGRQPLLGFALRPIAPNGRCPDYGEVATDYVEVSVRYRR